MSRKNKDDNPDPRSNKAAVTLMWLAVGLAPIPIILLAGSANGPPQGSGGTVLLVFCVICNLLGGFGCVRNTKGWAARIALGLFLAGCFFAVSVIVAVFEACSHMQF